MTRFVIALAMVVAALMARGVGSGGELVGAGNAAPEIARGEWINSPPLTLAGLRGRVVLVEFWTYG